VTVRGQITALLAMGVGFNRALSGRENIFLGGLASGRTPDEIEAQMDEIIAFADLGEFIDMPMNTYSSGMYGRLAFAVGVNIDPDILLVDEALSAGDASFRQKATQKMRSLVDNAGTILLVSHGLGHIEKLATHCLWLHKGEVMGYGEPRDMIKAYTDFVQVKQSEAIMEDI
jgi:teichoic acid transport system ATP-binding protein